MSPRVSWRPVPLRYQLTTNECGAACLAMIASYHGRHTAVSECRDLLGSGRGGVSTQRIVNAASALALDAHLDRGTDPLAHPLRAPAIAYLASHHFVVLDRIGRRYLRIADPATGRELWTREQFRSRYGGDLIRLAPGPRFRSARIRWRDTLLVRYLREFVAARGSRRLLLGIVAVAAALQGLGLAVPLATRFVVDQVVPQSRHDLLPLLAIGAVGTAALYGVLALVRGRLLVFLRARADRVLTQRFVRHLHRLPMPYFLERSRGDLLLRLASVSGTRETLTHHTLVLLLDAALLSGYLVGLAIFAPPYVALVLGLGLAQVAVLAGSYRRIRMLARWELHAKAEEQAYLVQMLEAIASVKANGIEHQVEARWLGMFHRYRDAMLRRGIASSWVESAEGALGTLGPLVLMTAGVSFVLQGDMSLGTMLAANGLAMSVLAPIQTLVGTAQNVAVLRAQVERIYDVMDARAEASGVTILPRDTADRVEASQLTFRYEPQGPAVVSDVTFTLPSGAKLGVVGRTGSGKSTLAMLVLGLLRPERGTLLHDGVPIAALDLSELRRGCGAVLQHSALFAGSILDNITLGRGDVDQSDVEEAARTAGLHADVLLLPMGYHTMVGESGVALSAGQRQRVALARALVHRPRLLVLDEATSHLDPATERQVEQALSDLKISRIVISHRLSAVRDADDILVLDQGRVVARGRHDELMAKGGTYQEMFGPGHQMA
jgi:ATP-binding cassette, subfamily B, bacterial